MRRRTTLVAALVSLTCAAVSLRAAPACAEPTKASAKAPAKALGKTPAIPPAKAPTKKKVGHASHGPATRGPSAPSGAAPTPHVAEPPALPVVSPVGVEQHTLQNGLVVVVAPEADRGSVTVAVRLGPPGADVGNAAWALAGEWLAGRAAEVASTELFVERDRMTLVSHAPPHALTGMIEAYAKLFGPNRVGAIDLEEARAAAIARLPSVSLDDRFEALVFQGYPPFDKPRLGARSEIDKTTAQEVERALSALTSPSNATLSVSGALDAKRVSEAIGARFGALAKRALDVSAARLEEQTNQRFAEVRADGETTTLLYGWALPEGRPDDRAALWITAAALTGGPSSRLGKTLGQEGARSEAGVDERRGPSLFWIRVELAPGVDPAAARKQVEGALTSMAKEPLGAGELERARVAAFTKRASRADDPTLDAIDLAGGATDLAAARQALSTVDAAQIRETAAKRLGPLARTIVTRADASPAAARKAPPKPEVPPSDPAKTKTARPEKADKPEKPEKPENGKVRPDPKGSRRPAKKRGP